MKRFIEIRSLMLTIVLLLGALPVAANNRILPDDPNPERPLALKPFALNGKGLAAFIIDEAGNVIGANVTAAGTANHLGLWIATGRVTFTNDNGVIRSSGEATIIDANGDKLVVVVQGTLDPVTNTDHGTFTFVGGTGKFARASGSADGVVVINPPNGGFEMTLVGRINY